MGLSPTGKAPPFHGARHEESFVGFVDVTFKCRLRLVFGRSQAEDARRIIGCRFNTSVCKADSFNFRPLLDDAPRVCLTETFCSRTHSTLHPPGESATLSSPVDSRGPQKPDLTIMRGSVALERIHRHGFCSVSTRQFKRLPCTSSFCYLSLETERAPDGISTLRFRRSRIQSLPERILRKGECRWETLLPV